MSPLLLICLLLFTPAPAKQSPPTGDLVLRATDIDTGKPIPGVSFALECADAEDWARSVGVADERGTLHLRTVNKPDYYYCLWPRPKGYEVAGLDDVHLTISPDRSTTHTFLLRKENSKPKLPPIISVPPDHRSQVPAPRQQSKNVNLASSVDNMPGFEGKKVTFWFYPGKIGHASAAQLAMAEKIFVNGKRVAAAVRDELTYFQKAVPEDHGEIDKMSDILIEVGERGGTFWCRLPNGLKLRQYGYKVMFTDLDHWELIVPDYLQEVSSR